MYTQEDLVYLMQKLRDPEHGCPWDARQDFASLARYTLEEAYEVVESIETGDIEALEVELGDLLFQVVFHSQLATEQGRFDLSSVIDRLVSKLVKRHPHVFADGTLYGHSSQVPTEPLSETGIKSNWEAIKEAERKSRGDDGLFADIPISFPAILRAEKLQKRLARKGIDWDSVKPVLEQLRKEIDELEEAFATEDSTAIEHELGDILFSAVNLSRKLDADPERALRKANHRFVARCEYINQTLLKNHECLENIDQDVFDELWEEAKSALSCD